MTNGTILTYQVYVAPVIAMAGKDVPPGQSRSTWSPISATLICGRHDAVLVDPLMTVEQGMAVADWVSTTGKNLTTVYVTHGHGDHWFGTDLLLQRFPDAVPYATNGTIAMMRQQGTVGRAEMWDVDFPDQIPPSPVTYRTVPADGIELEGRRLVAVEVGHTDTDDTSVLHVPDLALVVAGDVIYNGVHQYLAESAGGGLEAWLAAIDQVEQLGARHITAGHKDSALDDDAGRTIAETRRYLHDARELREQRPGDAAGDLDLSVIALALVLASFWFARHSRRWRLAIIAFAAATQLVPMVVREPVLLLPLLGALIPVGILVGCLVALSKKGPSARPPQGS